MREGQPVKWATPNGEAQGIVVSTDAPEGPLKGKILIAHEQPLGQPWPIVMIDSRFLTPTGPAPVLARDELPPGDEGYPHR